MKFSTLLAIALMLAGTVPAFGQSEFTYQGSLQENNLPANGVYDLSFSLYNAASAGTRIGFINYRYDVAITNGLFTVSLDFGASSFETSSARWLEIAARPAGESNPFTPMTPRQSVSFAPRALYATSSPASGLIGSISTGNIASGSITSDKLATNSVTIEKLARSEFFAISPTGELHVNGISTNEPALPFPGTMTVSDSNIQPPFPVFSGFSVLEMPRIQLELNSSGIPTGPKTVSPLRIRRQLGADTSWKRWMSMLEEDDPLCDSITLNLGANRQAVLEDAFPTSYQIERGYDGIFYETLAIKANRLTFQ